jgi:hypothetical protein
VCKPVVMSSQPGGDNWAAVVTHRTPDQRDAVIVRLSEAGVTPEQAQEALRDGGDALYAASRSGRSDWAEPFGGPLGAALLAAEVSALSAHLVSRASAVRALAVDALLEDYSAVAVAAALGISRQKVYDLGKGGSGIPFIDTAPWRLP